MHKVSIVFYCCRLCFFSLFFHSFVVGSFCPVVGHVVTDKSSSAPSGKKNGGHGDDNDQNLNEEKGGKKPTTKR